MNDRGSDNYYAVLGLNRNATRDEINSAYERLVRTVHPSAGGSAALFDLVQEAYGVLSNPSRRFKYDQMTFGPFAPPSGPPHGTADPRQSASAQRRNWPPPVPSIDQVPQSQRPTESDADVGITPGAKVAFAGCALLVTAVVAAIILGIGWLVYGNFEDSFTLVIAIAGILLAATAASLVQGCALKAVMAIGILFLTGTLMTACQSSYQSCIDEWRGLGLEKGPATAKCLDEPGAP